ncbi:MAG: undecaprenyl-diphosphatase UppP [Candidatus Omnitrophica bacterium]|nr:undecaprenyl-diphosphatase UppP [Candidatus Omnitrophota bacterium]
MNLIDVFILSIVEGITEFLPVSSTGHMILTSRLFGLAQTEFLKSFEISIQLGAILAVAVLYWRRLLTDIETIKRIVVAFIPTGVIGFVLYSSIKHFLMGNSFVVLWALFLGGIFIIVFESLHREKECDIEEMSGISYKQAFLIGVIQSLAVVPGVSRSAATIIGGLMLGLKRKTILEFSFLLAIPTMASATALDLAKTAFSFTGEEYKYLAIGLVISFASAMLSVKFLLTFIKNNSFTIFGIYRILLAIILWRIII